MEDRKQGLEDSMDLEEAKSPSSSFAEVRGEGEHWEDSKIDTLPIYKVTRPRDQAELDSHIAMWMKCAASTASPPEGFVAATIYMATQMRKPLHEDEFLFPEGPDGVEPLAKLIPQSYLSTFADSEALKADQAEKLRLIVPALAMFCLKTVYHRNYRISKVYEKAIINIVEIYGYCGQTSAFNVSVSVQFGDALRKERLAGSVLANSALIPALKAFKKAKEAGVGNPIPTETGSGNAGHLLIFCIVLSADCYELTVIGRLRRRPSAETKYYLENTLKSESEEGAGRKEQAIKIVNFLARVAREKSFYYRWARALSGKFESQLSPSKMRFTTAVWTWLLTDNPRSSLWGSAELWTLDAASIEKAKKVARHISYKCSGLSRETVIFTLRQLYGGEVPERIMKNFPPDDWSF